MTRSKAEPSEDQLKSLSADSKIVVSYMKNELAKVLATVKDLKELTATRNAELVDLKKTIETLIVERTELKSQVVTLQQDLKSAKSEAKSLIDDQDQYERKDSVILSGPAICNMVPDENTNEIVRKLVSDHLKVNIQNQRH